VEVSERADDTNHQPVKLLLSFDPLPDRREDYVQYVLGEFVPSLARAGLPMCEAWHTAYGRYPLRLTGFLAPDLEALEHVLGSESFHTLETRLQEYVENYKRRVVTVRRGFQF
jgi:hypothetical protein